jgi:hypothetical protein
LSPVPPEFSAAAAEAYRRTAARHPLDASRIETNPLTESPGALPIYLVADATPEEVGPGGCPLEERPHSLVKSAGHPEYDSITVRDICHLLNRRLYCSSTAVDAILHVTPPEVPLSPLLFYVLSHEFAHFALHHPGSWGESTISIPAAADAQQVVHALRLACSGEKEMFRNEDDADAEAVRSFVQASGEPPLASPGTPHASFGRNVDVVYESAGRLLKFFDAAYGSGTDMSSPLAFRVCGAGSKGLDHAPFGGGHPHAWRRLGLMMTRLFRGLVSDSNPDSVADQLVDNRIWSIHNDAFSYGSDVDVALKNFCNDLQSLADNRLDCADASYPDLPLADPKTGHIIIVTDQTLKPMGIDLDKATDYVPVPLSYKPHRDVVGSAFADYLNIHVKVFSSSRADAEAALHKWQTRVHDAFEAVDRSLSERGGFFVHYFRAPDTMAPDVSGLYSVELRGEAFARTSEGFDLGKVPEWQQLSAFALHKRLPWEEAQFGSAVFFDEGKDQSALQVETTKQPLDFYFDLRAARGGSPDQTGSALTELICYVQPQLEKSRGAPLTLAAADQLPFLLDLGMQSDVLGLLLGGCGYSRPYPGPPSRPAPDACSKASRTSNGLGKKVVGVSNHGNPIGVGDLLGVDR